MLTDSALSGTHQLSGPWAVKDENVALEGAESWMSSHPLVGAIDYS